IVDEVLAVGDAEFQKKALGKMKDVSGKDGRTVLFVSHNMAAVQNLCTRAMYLKNGIVDYVNNTSDTINYYLSDVKRNTDKSLAEIEERKGNGKIQLKEIIGYNQHGEAQSVFLCGDKMKFKIIFESTISTGKIKGRLDIGINNFHDIRVAWLSTSMFSDYLNIDEEGITFTIEKLPLMPGSYNVNLYCETDGEVADWLGNVFAFDIAESDFYKTGRKVPAGQGYVFLDYQIQ
ncbi:MAG: ABC transporter ATP-binding protein, partial [Bacteroidetes bacterium]|nr:ABC transporter ATP-binding protein [Bacteroidota bacterium]